jgi:hypothetical protein
MIVNQSTFLGGLSGQFNELRVDPSTYQLLVNGRVRDNSVEAVFSPLQDTNVPEGLYQNLTAIGSVLIVFVSGNAYYKDVASGETGWRRAAGVSLDPTVDTIDTTDIPSSTLNFKRTGPIDNVQFANSSARATAEGVLATDGVTQSVLLYPLLGGDIEGRLTFNYSQWVDTEDGMQREYVPIGRFPRYVGSKCYMAIKGAAGKLNRVGHSVTGRPLDFVVAIDNTTGDKAGDALTTAHAVGYDEITGIFASGSDDAIVVTTGRNTVGVAPDWTDRRFFGEPRFNNFSLFPSGVINPNSVVDLNGDTAFISTTGIHSFNAVMQTKWESNNDPISVQISRLLAPSQTYGAAIDFNDYAFFAVETIYGPGVVVYDKAVNIDTKVGKFVSIDLYRGIGRIKQFAKVHTPSGQRLFFITADNRLFEYGAASTRETCRLYIGDWNGELGGAHQVFRRALLTFSDVHESAVVQVSEYVDRVMTRSAAYQMDNATKNTASTISLPYAVTQNGSNQSILHQAPDNSSKGFAVGIMVEWSSDAKLVFLSFELNVSLAMENHRGSQMPGVKAAITEFALAGNLQEGIVSHALYILGDDVRRVGVGNIISSSRAWSTYDSTLVKLRNDETFYGVAGSQDLEVPASFFGVVTTGARYYSLVWGDTEVFFYNVGWTAANIGTATGDADGFELGSTQANWLKGALAASTARFKIVVMGFPPYADTGYSQLRLPFRSWGATLVVGGHRANYQRYIVDGFNYITCGTGGQTLAALGTPGTGYQAGRSQLGYLRITTDAFKLTTAHVGTDGTVYDEFIIYP